MKNSFAGAVHVASINSGSRHYQNWGKIVDTVASLRSSILQMLTQPKLDAMAGETTA